ncbi:hypothetical protein BC629DRAFT_1442234 [Irpex lacteus]|nr:hypothetical protein BC629DRAFT_1442234 [Irpex lacteus]
MVLGFVQITGHEILAKPSESLVANCENGWKVSKDNLKWRPALNEKAVVLGEDGYATQLQHSPAYHRHGAAYLYGEWVETKKEMILRQYRHNRTGLAILAGCRGPYCKIGGFQSISVAVAVITQASTLEVNPRSFKVPAEVAGVSSMGDSSLFFGEAYEQRSVKRPVFWDVGMGNAKLGSVIRNECNTNVSSIPEFPGHVESDNWQAEGKCTHQKGLCFIMDTPIGFNPLSAWVRNTMDAHVDQGRPSSSYHTGYKSPSFSRVSALRMSIRTGTFSRAWTEMTAIVNVALQLHPGGSSWSQRGTSSDQLN